MYAGAVGEPSTATDVAPADTEPLRVLAFAEPVPVMPLPIAPSTPIVPGMMVAALVGISAKSSAPAFFAWPYRGNTFWSRWPTMIFGKNRPGSSWSELPVIGVKSPATAPVATVPKVVSFLTEVAETAPNRSTTVVGIDLLSYFSVPGLVALAGTASGLPSLGASTQTLNASFCKSHSSSSSLTPLTTPGSHSPSPGTSVLALPTYTTWVVLISEIISVRNPSSWQHGKVPEAPALYYQPHARENRLDACLGG